MDQENAKSALTRPCQKGKGLRIRATNVTSCQENATTKLLGGPPPSSRRATDAQHQQKGCRAGCDDSRVQPRAEKSGAGQQQPQQHQQQRPVTGTLRPSVSQPPQVFRPQPIADIDWNDRGDPQLCAEYVTDIFNHLVVEERKPYYLVHPKFLGAQLNIGAHHRTVLVDWLVQVVDKLQLSNVTLHAMVDLIDRYLQASDAYVSISCCF